MNKAFTTVNKQLDPQTNVVLYAPEFFSNLSVIIGNLTATPEGTATLHDYLVWHVVKNFVGYLSLVGSLTTSRS